MVRFTALIVLASLLAVRGQVAPPPPSGNESPDQTHRRLDGFAGHGNSLFDPEIRERLEPLLYLSPAQVKVELEKWPRYQKMSLGEQGKMLEKIQEFQDHRRQMALNKAKELNLNLLPSQFEAFEIAYGAKLIAIQKQLRQEMAPRRKQLDEGMNQELKARFGSAAAGTSAPASASPPSPQK